ncbi:MAG: divalent-cation tolerance protein CutA [Anaplasma ovis]|uniref:Divalent-cation tolerance protein CutA n=1 Tax=Anaplasma ovis str. Haibei TaxID=1248439 RepID=A0A2Z2LEB3_9RICK|nr:divalent-cation tolerance protein CutA [Anaplasma ovis]ASI47603.1 divalent-cation tolerance protein CutA [Anaplasma ovis str. Haibei]
MEDGLSIVYATFPDYDTAYKIGSSLLQDGVVACVNIFSNVTAMYMWDEEMNTSEECVAVMKTVKSLGEEVINRILEQHPYDVPALFSIDAERCSLAFLEWVALRTGTAMPPEIPIDKP